MILHGLAGSATEFIATANALSASHRILLIDQRGHGCSTRVPDNLSRRAFVDDVVAHIEGFADEQVTLVGQSMGGNTALLVAQTRPDLVRHLVMVEAHPHGDDGGVNGQALEEYFQSWSVPFVDRQQAVAALGDSALARAWAADFEHVEAGFSPRFDPAVMRKVIEPVHRPHTAEWRELSVPVTAMVGEHGVLSADRRASLREEQPTVEVVEIAGAGHDPHLDAPDAWMAELRAVLMRAAG
ncbi:alpha/beta fold hydrolase [Microcella putealis]|uniref:alpha/beta fold hydrolase n=1 Tax=Microcella putealis TaxID=337005 RepID=UPI0013001EAA|nr:alpha/beta hydrolase [Microcella putealis]